ncbi:MAG: nitroreductase family protein [Thermoplasmatota archaeon]|nr:nitroreductase family protein [Halobacteriales archaeon]
MQQTDLVHARQPDHPVEPMFVRRWSPRSFKPDAVPRHVLESMTEAARWAPSSGNLQPWTFYVTGERGATRDAWNGAVNAFNRAWSDAAPVLVWVVARKTMGPNPYGPPDSPNAHAWFDTGAAAIQFVLEGGRHGVKSHYLGGIDAAKAHHLLGLDAEHEVVCAIVAGYAGEAGALPERLRVRETPSPRKPASETVRFA